MADLKAVFLDLDGTLCDAGAAWIAGVEAGLRLLHARRPGLEPATVRDTWAAVNERLLQQLSEGHLTMAEVRERRCHRLLERLEIDDRPLAAEIGEALAATRLGNLRLYDDTLPALQGLRDRYHVGVITNGAGDDHDDSQWTTLRELGLLDLLDSIWISDLVGFRKPDPRIFEGALEEAGFDPSEALHGGDSLAVDVAGARAAGLRAVWVRRAGSGTADPAPEQARPDLVVDSLAALVEGLAHDE